MSGSALPPGARIARRVRIRFGERESWKTARLRTRAGRRLDLLIGEDDPGTLEVGEAAQVLLCADDAAYLHRARVLLPPLSGRMVLILEASVPERWQRREFFRMRVSVPMLLEGGSEARPASGLFRVVDLSGGGCLCLDAGEELAVGDAFQGRLKLPQTSESVRVRLRVVRRTRDRGRPAAGLFFEALREKDRQRIVCSLFAEYRRRRALECEPVPVPLPSGGSAAIPDGTSTTGSAPVPGCTNQILENHRARG
jgi:c-di-GMP-binding flagellar brake protein YcgR